MRVASTFDVLLALTLFCCGGGGGGSSAPAAAPPAPPPPPVLNPVGDAGPNQAVDEGDAVILSGDGSENTDSYSWQQTAGPGVQLNDSNSLAPTFTAPSVSGETVLTFELTASDDSGDSRTDSVSVVVIFPMVSRFLSEIIPAIPHIYDRSVR